MALNGINLPLAFTGTESDVARVALLGMTLLDLRC
jgi:hypothetical protein